MRDNKVQSVTRAVELIGLIAENPQGATVGRLAEWSSLHKSTVSRLIMTLEAAGAVHRPDKRSAVQIAPEFAKRFTPLNTPANLSAIARPILEEMSIHFGEATGLVLPENNQAVYVEQLSPNNAIQVKDWTGARFPLHTIAPGKLFLAYRSQAEQNRYLSQPLASYTQNTTTDLNTLRQAFKEIRESGVSWVFDEFTDGLSAVATPVFDKNGSVIAALAVFAPSYRFPDQTKIKEINLLMIDFANRCSAEVQHQLATNI